MEWTILEAHVYSDYYVFLCYSEVEIKSKSYRWWREAFYQANARIAGKIFEDTQAQYAQRL